MSLTLNMVGGGGGGLSPNAAVIHVTAPVGSTISFSKGGVVVKVIGPEESHVNADNPTFADWYYAVSSSLYGTFTLSATDTAGITETKSVAVSSNEQYDIVIKAIVPDGYQAVEYLQASSVGPRITVQTSSDDVYDTSKEYEFYAKFAPNSAALKAVFVYSLSPAQLNYLTYPTNRDEVYIGTNPVATLSASTLDAVSEVKIVAKNGAYSVSRNGTVITSGSYSGSLPVGGSIGLFDAASGADTTYRLKGRFIEFYQKADGQFMHHAVPCYRKSDNVAGMYDRTKKTFLPNSGTGTFVVGGDVT